MVEITKPLATPPRPATGMVSSDEQRAIIAAAERSIAASNLLRAQLDAERAIFEDAIQTAMKVALAPMLGILDALIEDIRRLPQCASQPEHNAPEPSETCSSPHQAGS